jgi:hypothetical protein
MKCPHCNDEVGDTYAAHVFVCKAIQSDCDLASVDTETDPDPSGLLTVPVDAAGVVDAEEQHRFRTFLKSLNVTTELLAMLTSKREEAVRTLNSVAKEMVHHYTD